MKFLLLLLATAFQDVLSQATCGKADAPPILEISNGEAEAITWPWTVKIYFGWEPWCCGTLIAPDWVITSARCVYPYEDLISSFSVTVGSNLGLQDMKIQKIFKHGAYNAKTNDNDIALIKLKTPVKIARDVKPACLPKTVLVPGTKCFLLQRRYDWSSRLPSFKIFQRKLTTLSNSECIAVKATQYMRKITSAVTCASCVDTKQQLTGELGGGLICRNGKDATWAFNGALSWGFRDRSNAPSAVFSNVHQVLDWVQKTMTSN